MTPRGDATDLSRRGFLRATAVGATATAAAGTATAQDDGGTTTSGGDGDGGTTTDGDSGTTTDGDSGTTTDGDSGTTTDGDGGGGTEEVVVGPGGDYTFEPGTDDPLYVEPGTTVNFVWDSDTHNIVVDSQPDDAGWEGHETIENTGFEYEFTFEVEGTYEYYCEPHRQSGMEATIEVTSNPPTPAPANTGPQIPPPARTMGIVATATMVSTLGVAYFFLKYGDD